MIRYISTEKLDAMHKAWTAEAASRALPIKKLRDRVAEGVGGKNSFKAEEVARAMALVSEFYLLEGRVKMLEELQADLEKASGVGQAAPQVEAPSPESWRLP